MFVTTYVTKNYIGVECLINKMLYSFYYVCLFWLDILIQHGYSAIRKKYDINYAGENA